jgi:7-dehydrocholesterol reductase
MSTAESFLKNQLDWLRATLGPLFLILVCPPTVFAFWYTNVQLDGSFSLLWNLMAQKGPLATLYEIWSPYFFGTATAWTMIAVFAFVELAFMRVLPGKLFKGPITPAGNIPIYKANGVLAFALSVTLFCVASFYLELFSPTIIYDNFGGLLGALNIFSLFFCAFLLIKGYVAPSSTDVGGSGNTLFDFYWGMELYPRIFGWDIKMFTNCRFGMMGWSIAIISFAAKQSELYGISNSMLVAVTLQMLYITKFFIWETGYLGSLDIMHDRAGYYICWGCLVWILGVYTSPTMYLVNHPNELNSFTALAILTVGAASILINYWADRQRQKVRSRQGQCTIWGKAPVLTVANYTTSKGEKKQNLLLASGWWGIARHFHYLPEILGAFCWSVPALFNNFLPYFYVTFLTVLLIDRAFRDDKRCSTKYGADWQNYCSKVPYKIIPYFI